MGKKIDIAYFLGNLKRSFDKRLLLLSFRTKRMLAKQDLYVFCDHMLSTITEEIDAFTLFSYCRDNNIPAAYIAVKDGFLYKSMCGKSSEGIYFEKEFQEDWFSNKDISELLVRALAVVTSFGGINIKTENFIKRLGIEYIFIQHGVSLFRVYGLRFLKTEREFDRILVSNEYEKDIFRKRGWQEEQFISAGFPRWDRFSTRDTYSSRKQIFLFFTWRMSFTEKSADPGEFEYIKRLRSFLASKRLKHLKDKYQVEFIMAAHHALQNFCGVDLPSIAGDSITFVDSHRVSWFIAEASMLVTDFSSVSIDFYFQNKPVIFYRLDENDDKLSDIEKEDFKAIAAQKTRFYNILNDENEVFDRIEHYIKQDFKMDAEEQEKAKAFFYTKENLCEKVMAQIAKS